MVAITNLPCEIIAMVLRNLDDISLLISAIRSCYHFYAAYKESPGIAAEILCRRVPKSLLPYTAALVEISHLPHKCTRAQVVDFFHRFTHEPEKLVSGIRSMPLVDLSKADRTYSLINQLTTNFAYDAWKLMFEQSQNALDGFCLRPTEHLRFSRAFYRAELLFAIFQKSKLNDIQIFQTTSEIFSTELSMWENEQLSCVHDYLENILSTATRKVVTRDVGFRESSRHYGPSRTRMRRLMSQGIEFISDVINQTSYDKQRAMLRATLSRNTPQYALTLYYSTDWGDHLIPNGEGLAAIDIDGLRALASQLNPHDPDEGPFFSFQFPFRGMPTEEYTRIFRTRSLRRIAYVLWDWERIQHYQLANVYQQRIQSAT